MIILHPGRVISYTKWSLKKLPSTDVTPPFLSSATTMIDTLLFLVGLNSIFQQRKWTMCMSAFSYITEYRMVQNYNNYIQRHTNDVLNILSANQVGKAPNITLQNEKYAEQFLTRHKST